MPKTVRTLLRVALTAGLVPLAVPAQATASPPLVPLGVDECAVDVNGQGVVATETHLVDRGRVLPLPGGLTSAVALNDRGQVAGQVDGRPAFWDGRRLHLIGVADPADTFSSVSAVSSRGEVVGTSGTLGGERHAWRWRGGVLTALPGLGGSTGANDVNDRGQVVGDAWVDGQQRAVRWEADGTLVVLPGLGDGTGSRLATAVDRRGAAAGYSYTAAGSGDLRATRWSATGEITDISPAGHQLGIVADLNDRGVVVGSIHPPQQGQQGFVQDPAGRTWLVGSAPGATVVLTGVNDVGVAVGCLFTDDGLAAVSWRR